MFRREHHIRIATILQSLSSEVLLKHQCLFGGGTAIVLSHDEYRESVDLDFIVSNKDSYRELRQMLTAGKGLGPIIRNGTQLSLAREIRADQYGIRTLIAAGGDEIKFEIVLEARIALEPPKLKEQICSIATLTRLDMAACKLLANSDRWSDDGVFSRDIIDLAMLNLTSAERKSAIEKAASAYGDSILRDLNKAIDNLKNRRGRLEKCMISLKIDSVPEVVLWSKIRSLIK